MKRPPGSVRPAEVIASLTAQNAPPDSGRSLDDGLPVDLGDVVFLIGAALVAVGFWLVLPALAFAFLGIMSMVIAWRSTT